MAMSQFSILTVIVVLALIAGLVGFIARDGSQARISTLGALAFALVVAGIVFGERREVGYGLIGLGVLLAIVDAVRRRGHG